eukprot:SAG11_NODE_19970_length_455_cov_1.011236_1_plen_31_part_10
MREDLSGASFTSQTHQLVPSTFRVDPSGYFV